MERAGWLVCPWHNEDKLRTDHGELCESRPSWRLASDGDQGFLLGSSIRPSSFERDTARRYAPARLSRRVEHSATSHVRGGGGLLGIRQNQPMPEQGGTKPRGRAGIPTEFQPGCVRVSMPRVFTRSPHDQFPPARRTPRTRDIAPRDEPLTLLCLGDHQTFGMLLDATAHATRLRVGTGHNSRSGKWS